MTARRSATPRRAGQVPELPFAMPSRAAMRAANKPVWALFLYMTLYGRSNSTYTYMSNIDPKIKPAWGGDWGQVPHPIIDSSVVTTFAARQAWCLFELTRAANIGIDTFLQFLGPGSLAAGSTAWRMTEQILPLYEAAKQFSAENATGFTIAPDITMRQVALQTGTLADPVYWADQVAPLLQHPAALWRNGRPIVSLYHVTNMPPQWYIDFAGRLSNTYGLDITMIPAYQGNLPADMDPYIPLFQSGIFGMFNVWGIVRYDTAPSANATNFRTWASSKGIPYVGSIGPAWENDRRELLKNMEGYGVGAIQNQFEASIYWNDPIAKISTWSDNEEQHAIRPATGYQYVPYDITAYYIAKYKMGVAPTITRDALYYLHRMHLSTMPRDPAVQTAGVFDQSPGPFVDKVLTMAMLTAPADVTVTTGGVARTHAAVPAGLTTLEDPLTPPDVPKFKATRGGVDVVPEFSSAFPTRVGLKYQDLLYRMGSSTRVPLAEVQSSTPDDRL
jgi:hypothetical protein